MAEPEPAPAPEPAPEPEAVAPAEPVVESPAAAAPEPLVAPEPEFGAVSAGAARVVSGSDADPLKNFEVNALVIKVGERAAVFASADLPAFDAALTDAVAAKLAAGGSTLAADQLLLGATGADTGWLTGVMQGVMPGVLYGAFDQAAFDTLTGAFVEAITQAEAAIAPAAYLTGESEAPEYHAAREGASTTADSTLGFLLVQNHAGEPLGAILNYAIQPPRQFGDTVLGHRGFPGALAEAVRAKTKAEMPVVFYNGVAGDLDPVLPEDPAARTEAAAAIAGLAMASLEGATPRKESSLWTAARRAELPVSLLGEILPTEALLTEIHLSDEVFVSMPGAPAAQIGVLLRVKALEQGAGGVFLCSHASDFQWYHPGITEYMLVSERARSAFHGPLMIKWYAENCLAYEPSTVGMDMIPELASHKVAFEAGVKRGEAERAALEAAWALLDKGLQGLGKMMPQFKDKLQDLPPDATAFLDTLKPKQLPLVARQVAATYLRAEFADNTAEERVTIMGVAQGAGLAYDAVVLLDTLSRPEKFPQEVQAILMLLQLQGYKVLE